MQIFVVMPRGQRVCMCLYVFFDCGLNLMEKCRLKFMHLSKTPQIQAHIQIQTYTFTYNTYEAQIIVGMGGGVNG